MLGVATTSPVTYAPAMKMKLDKVRSWRWSPPALVVPEWGVGVTPAPAPAAPFVDVGGASGPRHSLMQAIQPWYISCSGGVGVEMTR